MAFQFKVKTPGIARYVIDFQGSKVFGKPLTNAELEVIRKKHTKIVKNGRTGEKTDDPDYNAILKEKFVKTVHDWDFLTSSGEQYPCTDETKDEMFEYNTTEAMEILGLFDAVTGEDAVLQEKN